jgi:hypothetical protein
MSAACTYIGISLPEGGPGMVVSDNDGGGETLSEKDTLIVTIRAAGPVCSLCTYVHS